MEKEKIKQIQDLIIDKIKEYSGCTKDEAIRFYEIAKHIDIDLWEHFDSDIQEYFKNTQKNTKKTDNFMSDTEYYAMKGIKSGKLF